MCSISILRMGKPRLKEAVNHPKSHRKQMKGPGLELPSSGATGNVSHSGYFRSEKGGGGRFHIGSKSNEQRGGSILAGGLWNEAGWDSE